MPASNNKLTEAHDDRIRPSRKQCGDTQHVIRMVVSEKDAGEWRTREGLRNRVHMRVDANTGVNQRRLLTEQEPRVVSGATGPFGRVSCRNEQWEGHSSAVEAVVSRSRTAAGMGTGRSVS